MTTMEMQTSREAWRASPSRRAQALAERLERGASALESLAETLTPNEWESVVPGDGRTIGVIVHHVASMYPLEIELAQGLAEGRPIAGVTWAAVHEINAEHARANSTVSKEEALDLLRRNSAAAVAVIRAFSDEQLDAAATISLNADAPLTCQFFLEDHAVRHSFHHFARIRAALPTVIVCGSTE
jgi:hypothetical protein